jgi:hypothetical protein
MRKSTLIGVLICCLPALAWGPEGHSLVARLADGMLTPAARAQVLELLGPNTSMASIASWADEVRQTRKETAPWHFIDIPISQPKLDMQRDCPKNDCVIAKINEFRKVFYDKTAPAAQRKDALQFLVHFIGDMHQPLHCSDDGDKGGNLVAVQFHGERMNLHHLWDVGFLSRMPPEDELFGKLSEAITPELRAEWSRGSVEDWAEESHQIGTKLVYGQLPRVPKTEPAVVSDAYESAAIPVVQERIEKAAVRLAAVLNGVE